MNKEISENLKEALENLQWCQTNVLYYEINNDKARELYKYIQELQHQLEEKDKIIDEAFNKIETLRMEKWAIMGTDIMELLEILERGKK